MNGKKWLGTIVTASVFITTMAGVAFADTGKVTTFPSTPAKEALYKHIQTETDGFGQLDLNRFVEAIAELPTAQQEAIASLTEEWEDLQEAGRHAVGFPNAKGVLPQAGTCYLTPDLTEEQHALSESYRKRQEEIQEELRDILLTSNLIDLFAYTQQ